MLPIIYAFSTSHKYNSPFNVPTHISFPSPLTARAVISDVCYRTSVFNFLEKISWILTVLSQEAEKSIAEAELGTNYKH